jgi:hypothetical protein
VAGYGWLQHISGEGSICAGNLLPTPADTPHQGRTILKSAMTAQDKEMP